MTTVLVTGASSGIGEATVRKLLAEGYHVFAAARRLERMKSLEAAGAKLLHLDLTDDASITTAAAQVGDVDILVNNAGYGSYGALEDVPMEEARRQFEVNVFGLARLTQLVTPGMRAKKNGAIVNVGSIGGKFGEPMGSWYHATKYAVEGLSDSLRMELTPFGIRVILIEPGAIATEWAGIAVATLRKASGNTAYREQAELHARMFESADLARMASPPAVVADTIAQALKAKRPRTRYATGGGAPMFLFMVKILPDRALDWLMRMAEKRMAK